MGSGRSLCVLGGVGEVVKQVVIAWGCWTRVEIGDGRWKKARGAPVGAHNVSRQTSR